MKSTEQQIEEYFQYFWGEGNGYEFKTWACIEPKLASDEQFDLAFQSYDKKADEIVSKMIKDKTFGQVLQNLTLNGDKTKFPPDLLRLMSEMEAYPDWLDLKLLTAGVELSQRAGLLGLLILRNYCLLGGYYYSSLTKLLVATGSLEKGAKHRLSNTLSFWVGVVHTGKDAQKQRLNACLKTRLVHSAARLMLLRKKNQAEHNIGANAPLNDMDMIATHISFTLYFLFALKKFGFKMSQEEESGIFHLWKYHTWLLGTPVALIPNNKKEAVDFFYYWTSKQGLPDEGSIKLVETLLAEITPLSIYKPLFNRYNLPFINKSTANFLIDKQTLTALQIPNTIFSFVIPALIKLKNYFLAFSSREVQIKKGYFEITSALNDYL